MQFCEVKRQQRKQKLKKLVSRHAMDQLLV